MGNKEKLTEACLCYLIPTDESGFADAMDVVNLGTKLENAKESAIRRTNSKISCYMIPAEPLEFRVSIEERTTERLEIAMSDYISQGGLPSYLDSDSDLKASEASLNKIGKRIRKGVFRSWDRYDIIDATK